MVPQHQVTPLNLLPSMVLLPPLVLLLLLVLLLVLLLALFLVLIHSICCAISTAHWARLPTITTAATGTTTGLL